MLYAKKSLKLYFDQSDPAKGDKLKENMSYALKRVKIRKKLYSMMWNNNGNKRNITLFLKHRAFIAAQR